MLNYIRAACSALFMPMRGSAGIDKFASRDAEAWINRRMDSCSLWNLGDPLRFLADNSDLFNGQPISKESSGEGEFRNQQIYDRVWAIVDEIAPNAASKFSAPSKDRLQIARVANALEQHKLADTQCGIGRVIVCEMSHRQSVVELCNNGMTIRVTKFGGAYCYLTRDPKRLERVIEPYDSNYRSDNQFNVAQWLITAINDHTDFRYQNTQVLAAVRSDAGMRPANDIKAAL